MGNTVLICLFFLSFIGVGFGQPSTTGNSMDTWADRTYSVVASSGDTYEIRLADLKGKLTVLEFWNRTCTSCLTGMPRLYEISRRYMDRLHIMPVTTDNMQEVKGVFSRLKGGNYEFRLPTIYSDTVLSDIFRVKGVPYAVWLDEEGRFLAATGSEAVHVQVIEEVLRGNKAILTKYGILDKNSFYGLSKGDVEIGTELLSVSISPYDRTERQLRDTALPGSSGYTYRLLNRSLYQLIKTNVPLANDSLIHEFYADIKNKRMTVSNRIRQRYKDAWELGGVSDFDAMSVARDENLFCVTIKSGHSIPLSRRKVMVMSALEAFFDITVKAEKRLVEGLKIVDVPLYVTDKKSVEDVFKDSHVQSVGHLLNILNYYYPETPIVRLANDEWKTRSLSIIHNRDTPYEEFYTILQNLGIRFESEMIEMKMIVVE